MSNNWGAKTIPSAFVRTDQRTTLADGFVNVHDVHKLRLNHNKIVAEVLRRPVLSVAFNDGSNDYIRYVTTRSGGRNIGRPLLSVPFLASPKKTQLFVKIYAVADYQSGDGSYTASPELYPVVDAGGALSEIDSTVNMTVTSTTDAAYSATVKMPTTSNPKRTLHIYGETPLSGNSIKTAIAITASGSNWWEDADGSGAEGTVAVFSKTSAQTSPRLVVQQITSAAATYRQYVYPPFDDVPVPGTDTVSYYTVNGVTLYTLSAYELEIT